MKSNPVLLSLIVVAALAATVVLQVTGHAAPTYFEAVAIAALGALAGVATPTSVTATSQDTNLAQTVADQGETLRTLLTTVANHVITTPAHTDTGATTAPPMQPGV